MLLAPALRRAAAGDRRAARARRCEERLGERVDRVEVAGPGLPQPLPGRRLVPRRGRRGAGGRRRLRRRRRRDARERVHVEFVSANPTGPLTAASGRHAAYGDALARLLEFAGHEVEREYYFNDAGAQVAAPRRSRSAPARAARSRPRTATRATTSPSWRSRSRTPPSATPPRRWRARPSADPDRAHPRDARALPRRTSTAGSSSARCTRATRAPWDRAPHDAGRAGALLRVRGRAVAAHDRRSATTRTACSSARPASRPTSPPTSPTTRTSSSAATTASSTCWAPTTTATSRA